MAAIWAKVTFGDHFLYITRIIVLHYLCELLTKIIFTGGTALRRGITYYSFELFMCPTNMYRHAGTITVLCNIPLFSDPYYLRLFFCAFYALRGIVFFFALRGFPLTVKMAGIINSSQHCYFNSLLQCLANSSRIYDYLDDHERDIRNVVGT